MDEIDLKLVMMLVKGKKVGDIASTLKLTRQSVYYRIQKLRTEIDLKETISANLNKIGINTLILVLIKWRLEEATELEAFVKKLLDDPYVCLAMPLLGKWDYALIITAKSTQAYRKFIQKVHRTGGKHLQEWESYPITEFRKGELLLPQIDKLLKE